MPQFVASIASSEGTHRVLIEAPTQAEAKKLLELDYGQENVRALEPYVARAAIDNDSLQLRDNEIAEYAKRQKRRDRSAQRAMSGNQNIERQTMLLVMASLAVIALTLLFFGKALVAWFADMSSFLSQQ